MHAEGGDARVAAEAVAARWARAMEVAGARGGGEMGRRH